MIQALAVSALMALSASVAKAAQADVMGAGATRMPDNSTFELAGDYPYIFPDVGFIYLHHYFLAVCPQDEANDQRDSESYYVCVSEYSDMASFEFKRKGDGYTAMILHNPDTPSVEGMYLGVHDWYPKDRTDSGAYKLIVHSDKAKAGVWNIRDWGRGVMELVGNGAETGQNAIGQYLNVNPADERNWFSWYVSLVDDISEASESTIF